MLIGCAGHLQRLQEILRTNLCLLFVDKTNILTAQHPYNILTYLPCLAPYTLEGHSKAAFVP